MAEAKHENETRGKTDQQHASGPQGHVKDPQHDGRLKENRDKGVSLGTTGHSAKQPHAANKD